MVRDRELSDGGAGGRTGDTSTYVISKPPPRRPGRRLAALISNPGLQELLSPLGFALAAALERAEVSLYFQGPAVRVPAKGFTEKLHGPRPAVQPVRRAGLTRAGHLPAQQKIGQLQTLGARLFACGRSMRHFSVAKGDLAFPGVIVAEYLTFMEALARADIQLFIQ